VWAFSATRWATALVVAVGLTQNLGEFSFIPSFQAARLGGGTSGATSTPRRSRAALLSIPAERALAGYVPGLGAPPDPLQSLPLAGRPMVQ